MAFNQTTSVPLKFYLISKGQAEFQKKILSTLKLKEIQLIFLHYYGMGENRRAGFSHILISYCVWVFFFFPITLLYTVHQIKL